MKPAGRAKTALIAALLSLLCVAHNGCVNEPVDEDYFLDINKVKGVNKPEPAPVISAVTRDGNLLLVDFNGTASIDPDTGTADNLYYLFYWSSGDPALFTEELMYYDELYYVGYVSHADAAGDMEVVVNPGDYRGRIYFWMTAYDGRESDHSNVFFIDI